MWFFWSLGNAFTESLKDAFGKRASLAFDEYALGWAQRFFALPLLIVLALLISKRTQVDGIFWLATGGSVAINAVTMILYMRAVKMAPLSLALPVVTLSPIFLLFTSPLINKEIPSLLGVAGVLVSVAGTYLLSFSRRREGFWTPITSIWTNAGTRSMLIVAFLWAFSAPFDKIAVTHSDPYVYTAVTNLALALILLPFVLRKKREIPTMRWQGIKTLAPIGIFSGISIICQMIAFSLTQVPYVISIKRTSALFGILWGRMFFKEIHLRERLIGSLVILAGAVMILFA